MAPPNRYKRKETNRKYTNEVTAVASESLTMTMLAFLFSFSLSALTRNNFQTPFTRKNIS